MTIPSTNTQSAGKSQMIYRFMGRSGLKVSALSLGSFMTYGFQVKDADIAYNCVKTAYDHGINTFDSAELYGDGQAEIDMGKALKRLNVPRKDLVIITKIFWGGDGPNDRGLSRKHVIEGLDNSLKRLQLEYVDIVFAHRPDPDTPMDEIVQAFNHCLSTGKAMYWGTSEWTSQQITYAHLIAQRLNLVGPSCEQPQYNCFVRDRVEKEYLPLYKDFNMGTTIWGPMAAGVLTGKYNDGIPEDSRYAMKGNVISDSGRKSIMSDEGQAKIKKVKLMTDKIANKLECTPAQLALAWCMKNENVSTVLIGASRPEQIVENVKAVAVVAKLTPEIMAEIDSILGNKPMFEDSARLFKI